MSASTHRLAPPKTLSILLRHERRMALADRSLLIALAIFAAATLYALASGAAWLRGREADVALAAAQSKQRTADFQTDLRIYEAGQGATLGEKPGWYPGWIKSPLAPNARPGLASLPLALMASNAGEVQPALATMRVATSRYALFDDARASTQNPATLAVGRFDLVFLLTAVLPLLLLAFSHNLLSSELEQGTLALVAVQPVAMTRVVLAKLLSRAAVLLLPALSVIVVGLLLFAGVPASAAAWRDLGALLLMIVSYSLFWLLLSAWVNVRGRSSSSNALRLGGWWLALVLVIPSLLNLLVLGLQPPPDRAELTNRLRATVVNARNGGENLVSDFNLQHAEQPIRGDANGRDNFDSPKAILKSWLVAQASEAAVAPIADAFERRLSAQQQLAERLRFLSPALSFQSALNRLAGADRSRTEQFIAAVRDYQTAFRGYFVPKIEAGASMTADDLDRIPAFVMPAPRRGSALIADWLGLALPSVLLALLAARGFRRFRVGK